MDYREYLKRIQEIIENGPEKSPYSNPKYIDYSKLNYTRMNRWYKTVKLDENVEAELKKLRTPQRWIIIVEPWCGDAAPILPLLVKMAEQSPLITYELQFRDQEPFLINSYLTNGTRSIPYLIVRDEKGKDLFTWGPRPKYAQELATTMHHENVDSDTVRVELQNFYNKDKGVQIQQELLELLKVR